MQKLWWNLWFQTNQLFFDDLISTLLILVWNLCNLWNRRFVWSTLFVHELRSCKTKQIVTRLVWTLAKILHSKWNHWNHWWNLVTIFYCTDFTTDFKPAWSLILGHHLYNFWSPKVFHRRSQGASLQPWVSKGCNGWWNYWLWWSYITSVRFAL